MISPRCAIMRGGEWTPELNLQQTIPAHFARIASRFAGGIAVRDTGEQALTYADLDASFGAGTRRHHGQTGGEGNLPVALLLDNSARAAIAVLGVLKAGHAYAGLDPDSPARSIAGNGYRS